MWDAHVDDTYGGEDTKVEYLAVAARVRVGAVHTPVVAGEALTTVGMKTTSPKNPPFIFNVPAYFIHLP